MPIEVHCEGCGKRYLADDQMAGKRMRCRVCSTTFSIPDNLDSADPGDGFDAFGAIEPSAGFGHDSTILGHDHQVNLPAPDDDEPMTMTSSRGYRARFNYPYAAVVDRWLPILLLVLGPIWIVATAFASDDHATAGLTIARLLILMLTYLVLIFPMGLGGVNMAARDIGFSLPRTSTWRALATFMPTFAVGSVLWMVSGGHLWGLILGVVSGLVLSCGTLWLLFHLQPREIPAAAGYAGGMTALAVAIAGGALFGLNALLSTAMISMHKSDSLAGSPFGTGFYWPKSDAPAIVKPKPKPPQTDVTKNLTLAPPPVQTQAPATTPPPLGTPAPSALNTPAPELKPPGIAPTAATSPSQTLPPNPSQPVIVASAGPKPDPTKPLDVSSGHDSGIFPGAIDHSTDATGTNSISMTPTATTAPAVAIPDDQIIKSPLVESVNLAPLDGPYDMLLRPATPSPWGVVLRRGGERGQLERVWTGSANPPDGAKPWKAAGAAPYVPETKAIEKYALSPDGDLLAHVSTFPSFSVLVYSFKERRIVQTLKLQEREGSADVLGFSNAERLLVHRLKDGHDSMELWDVKANNRIKSFETPKPSLDCPAALSPDGAMLAMSGKDTPKSGDPTTAVFIFDLPAATVRKMPVVDLGTSADAKSTGLCFSVDGSKIGALFEQGANGLLVIFRSAGLGKQLLSQPLLPVPFQPDSPFNGSSLAWLNNDSLLLYGRRVLSGSSGVDLGDVGVLGATSQTFFKPDLCQLEIPSPHGVALVKLKMDDITKLQATK